MKIYTKTGDKGETALYGGTRVSKDDLRVSAYGSVDEANAAIGLARAQLQDGELGGDLEEIQNALFDVGADLATRGDSDYRKNIVPIDEEDVALLERKIDHYSEGLDELKAFILPGGKPGGASLQLARAVVRRAEREVVRLSTQEEVNPQVTIYLNRLSDLLFTMARVANMRTGVSETRWQVKGRARPDA